MRLRPAAVTLIGVFLSSLSLAYDPPQDVLTIGTFGSGDGQFDFPRAIAIAPDGTIFVSDTDNNRIERFTNGGVYLSQWGSGGAGDGQFNGPGPIAVGTDGSVYVVDVGNNRIERFSAEGVFLGKWGSRGGGDGQFISPGGLAVGPLGDIYVSDSGTAFVQRFSPQGVFLTKWGGGGLNDGQFRGLSGVGVGPDGVVYITEHVGRRIQYFTAGGTFLGKWGPPEWIVDFFPTGITVDGSGVVHLVVEEAGGYVLEDYTTDGTLLAYWWLDPDANGTPAVDAHGDLYVTQFRSGDEDNPPISFAKKLAYVHRVTIESSIPGAGLSLCAPPGTMTPLHLFATLGRGSSGGIIGAEFRVEVANPAGLVFSYLAPQDAVVVGNPLDLTPNNPNDHTGATILFSSCHPTDHPPVPGDRVDLGVISVLNYGNGKTDLRIRPKSPPENPSMQCVRLFLCDSPFFTPTCVGSFPGGDITYQTPLNALACPPIPSPPGAPVGVSASVQGTTTKDIVVQWQAPTIGGQVRYYNVYRQLNGGAFTKFSSGILNPSIVDPNFPGGQYCYKVTALDVLDQESPPSAPVCIHEVPPFTTQTLWLDTRETPEDGAAGPVVTSTMLDVGLTFLVTVSGTASMSPASNWNPPNVVCGRPDQAPQTPSPGATNFWVGTDAEVTFSQPFPPGGDCTTIGPAEKHHGRLQMDLGGGFVHLEPLGGTPSDPWPGHVYRYLVQGNLSLARFRWLDTSTGDNYGVLRITVERANPSETPALEPASSRILMLPNMPEPFNPSTTLRYILPGSARVTAIVFDAKGHKVRNLWSGTQAGGYQDLIWNGLGEDGRRLPSGVYYARISTPSDRAVQKLVLVK